MARISALVLILLWVIAITLAADTAIAIYMSNDCASAERPGLFTLGADILNGNCIVTSNATFQGPNSVQVVGIDGDCSVIVHVGDQCDAPAAVVGLHECVMITSPYSGSLPIGSISIHGGRCPVPDQAVLSESAKVPAASTTKTGDLLNPTTVLPTTTATAPTRTISIETADVVPISSGTMADPGSSIIRDGTNDEIYSTTTPGASSSTPATSLHRDDDKLAVKIAVPVVSIVGAAGCVWTFWILRRKRLLCWRHRKSGFDRAQHKHQALELSDQTPALPAQESNYRGNGVTGHAKAHLGNVYYFGKVTKRACNVM